MKNKTRREFLRELSLLGGAGFLGLHAGTAFAEGPMETTSIRLIRETKFAVLCYAPQYIAEAMLRAEGFTDISYVPKGVKGSEADALLQNNADMSASLGPDWIVPIANNEPLTLLSGLHAGCIEVFAGDNVQTLSDIRGKRLAITGLGSPERFLLASIAAYIGIDPDREIEWVFASPNDWSQMLADGDVDAIITFPPLNYHLHDNNIGHVILNTTTDTPWRHYFCCMIGARNDYVQNNPIATKRALRAILKANQLCSQEPQRMARELVEHGQATNYDYALRTLQDTPYDTWHEFDPEDSIRFYALRLREAGLIESSPAEIIERGTDWSYVTQLKKELKA